MQTLLKDIESDNEKIFKETEDGYIITTKVNYSNNKNLVKQNIYFNKNIEVTEVHVLDSNDNVQMKMKFTSTDMNATYDDKYFDLKENMASSNIDKEEVVSKLDEIIYPMYLPTNTHLSSQDTVSTTSGERIILTFDGEKPFMLVQETASVEDELTTIPMYGEPEILIDTVAAISDSSITWVSNGIEYYVVSEAMEKDELISVAKSISVMPVGK